MTTRKERVRTHLLRYSTVSAGELAAAVDVLARLAAAPLHPMTHVDRTGYGGAQSLVERLRYVVNQLIASSSDKPADGSAQTPPLMPTPPYLAGPFDGTDRWPLGRQAPALTQQTRALLDKLHGLKVVRDGKETSVLEAAASTDPYRLMFGLAAFEVHARKDDQASGQQSGAPRTPQSGENL